MIQISFDKKTVIVVHEIWKVIKMVDVKEEAYAEDAEKDLHEIEKEVVAEAEASVEDFDAMGDEQAAAEAAETAFEFEEAAEETE